MPTAALSKYSGHSNEKTQQITTSLWATIDPLAKNSITELKDFQSRTVKIQGYTGIEIIIKVNFSVFKSRKFS